MTFSGGMFSYVSLESRVPPVHPLRGIKALLDEALASMSRNLDRVYSGEGRPSIPPERLVRASTLQILCSIRSERLLCEQLDYNLLFRWFVGLPIDAPIWDHSSSTRNRDRLIEANAVRKLLPGVMRKAREAQLLSLVYPVSRKTISPCLRAGYLIAAPALAQRIARAKNDGNHQVQVSSSFGQGCSRASRRGKLWRLALQEDVLPAPGELFRLAAARLPTGASMSHTALRPNCCAL
jgi:transposase